MDPNACWEHLVEALNSDDLKACANIADELKTWINHGGFLPKVTPTLGLRRNGLRSILYCLVQTGKYNNET